MGYPQQYFVQTPMHQPQRFFNQAQAAVRGAQPRWQQQPRGQMQGQMHMGVGGNVRSRGPAGPRGMSQNQGMARPMGNQMMPAMMAAARPMQPGMPPQMAVAQQQSVAAAAAAMAGAPRANYKYTQGVRNPAHVAAMPQPVPPQQQQAQPAVLVQGQEPLTASMLAAAQPQEQKQMLGERLFPLIHGMYPDLAGKITGMLLEIDNSELVHMLEHQESLKGKVDEAVAVLQAHQNTKSDA